LFSLYLLKNGYGDAMLCGTTSVHAKHMRFVSEIVGLKNKKNIFSTMNALQLQDRVLFIADTYINEKDLHSFLVEKLKYQEREISMVRLQKFIKLMDYYKHGRITFLDWYKLINESKDWLK
jgi:malate dehydrogenase (oxaloacetate-decarboxylating)(NADP+)